MNDAYSRSVREVLEFFNVDQTKGLADLQQFDDLLVKILIAAAVVSFLLALVDGETGLKAFWEPSVILMILAANAAVGVITETNAEKALEELRAYQADTATVLRNGCFSILPATDLVPGDIVEVSVGCKIPADMRMIEMLTDQLRVDQAILTGESCSVEKELDSTSVTNAVYQDKTNILFSGTIVVAGRARAVVVGVGSNTAMGSIRDSMLRTEDEVTPLKKKLDEFGTFLAKVIAGICVMVWIVNIGHFRDPAHGGFLRGAIHYFKIAVALAVAAIPEGLPAVVTTCLALGTKRMARMNAIVRSLPSVETLGCTTVICSDKTGTLTTNMMSVSKICVLHSINQGSIAAEYSVSGTTYAPEGFIFDSTGVQLEFPAQFPCLLHIATCSALCNESVIQYNAEKRNYEKIGESTEVALRVLAEKVGLPGYDSLPSALHMLSKHERASYCNRYWENQFKKVSVLEFSRDRKMMSVLCSRKQMEIMFSKGAPESIISRCTNILCNDDGSTIPLTANIRAELESRFHRSGKETLRCLALALKRMPLGQKSLSIDDEKDLTFIGLLGKLWTGNILLKACSWGSSSGQRIGKTVATAIFSESVSVLEFSRDRKMMSVLCSRKQMEIMFSKGAPESIISRCTNILCNDDGSTIPLTANIRAELESRFHRSGKETLRCLALALKRMPLGQKSLSIDDEKDLTFIGLLGKLWTGNILLKACSWGSSSGQRIGKTVATAIFSESVGMLDPPREGVRNAILSCMTAGIRVIVVTGDNKATAESLYQKIGAFDHLIEFAGHSYTASEFEALPALQKTVALQHMKLFTRVEPSHKRMLVEALQHQNEVLPNFNTEFPSLNDVAQLPVDVHGSTSLKW
ncbi:unnamed protein product [Ilex paraguariensis]|uniref:P-type ATPase A domain-containing protein n=1 Tax=Ilex paraguariensis TaxID=185542 RepID=A0ABC8SLE7_9AQUA